MKSYIPTLTIQISDIWTFVFFLHFENTFISARTPRTLDCGWESKVVLQKINIVLLTNKLHGDFKNQS